MSKRVIAVIGVVIVAFGLIFGVTRIGKGDETKPAESTAEERDPNSPPDYSLFERSGITWWADKIDLSKVDPYKVHEASEDSGMMADNVVGDPSKAKVVIYEYADFQCSHCAEFNPALNQIVEASDGRVAVVFRNYVLSYNTNGTMVGAAVQAAAKQGYWEEYKDLVFANQAEWYYSKHSKLQGQLEKYFTKVAGEKGDLDQFRADMQSEEVARKLAMDMALANKLELKGTPSCYINGKLVALKDLTSTIEELLKK